MEREQFDHEDRQTRGDSKNPFIRLFYNAPRRKVEGFLADRALSRAQVRPRTPPLPHPPAYGTHKRL